MDRKAEAGHQRDLKRTRLLVTSRVLAVFLPAIGLGSYFLLTESGQHSQGTVSAQTLTASGPDLYNGVDQTQLQNCLSQQGDCMKTVTGLASCVAQHLVCDRAVAQAIAVAFPSVQTLISREAAESVAQALAKSPSTPAAPSTATTYSELTTYGQARTTTSFAENTAIDGNTPVWLITVHSPIATDGGPAVAPKIMPSYSVLLDAVNGKMIDMCIGCSTLSSSS